MKASELEGRELDAWVETVTRAHRAFIDAAQPFVQARVYLYSILVPTVVVYPDGRVVSAVDVPPNVQKTLDQIDERVQWTTPSSSAS